MTRSFNFFVVFQMWFTNKSRPCLVVGWSQPADARLWQSVTNFQATPIKTHHFTHTLASSARTVVTTSAYIWRNGAIQIFQYYYYYYYTASESIYIAGAFPKRLPVELILADITFSWHHLFWLITPLNSTRRLRHLRTFLFIAEQCVRNVTNFLRHACGGGYREIFVA